MPEISTGNKERRQCSGKAKGSLKRWWGRMGEWIREGEEASVNPPPDGLFIDLWEV